MKKQTSPTKSATSSTARTQGTRANGTSAGRGNTRSNGTKGNAQAARSTEGLNKLFEHQLMDLYYVEQQLTKHLPKMAEAAVNEDLAAAFTDHLSETEGQLERLETVFGIIGRPAKGQKCPAIDGILKEAKDLMDEFEGDAALDAALACAAQKVEHYEITSYGSLCAFAEQLGLDEVCDELEAILDEEKAADKKLSRLAETVLNIEADEATEETGSKPSARKTAKTATKSEKDEDSTEDSVEEEEDEDADTDTAATDSTSREKQYAEVN